MRVLSVAMLLMFASLPAFSTPIRDCSTDVLPDGPKECAFRHVPFESFEHAGGLLSVTWPENYELEEVFVARDWKKAFPYSPGTVVPFELSAETRYDVVARFTNRVTGEHFLGATPISVKSPLFPGDERLQTPGWDFYPAGDCGITSNEECYDAEGNQTGSVSVSCSGDRGSCADECGDSRTACCQATRTTTETSSDGTQSSVMAVMENAQSCPD